MSKEHDKQTLAQRNNLIRAAVMGGQRWHPVRVRNRYWCGWCDDKFIRDFHCRFRWCIGGDSLNGNG